MCNAQTVAPHAGAWIETYLAKTLTKGGVKLFTEFGMELVIPRKFHVAICRFWLD